MTIKNRKVIYQCKVDGVIGKAVYKGRVVSGICGRVRTDGTCGAHGNFKCEHKCKGD